MHYLLICSCAMLCCGVAFAQPAAPATKPAGGVLDYTLKDIKNNDVDLKQYQGKVVLIVNVASKCGFTAQYEQLEQVHRKYKEQGLVVLGFPTNDFGQQEPGTNEEIAEFCRAKFGVSFPLFSKLSVKGEDKAPLYQFLTSPKTNGSFAGEIGWNFTKFLVNRQGQVVARYDSKTRPDAEKVIEQIEMELAKGQPSNSSPRKVLPK